MVTASPTPVCYLALSVGIFEWIIVLENVALVQTPGHVVSTALLRKCPAPLGFLMGTSIGMMKTAEIPTQKEVSIQMEVMAVTPEWTTAVAMMDLDPLPSVFQLQLPLSSIPTAPPGANRYGKIRYCEIRTIPISYRGF